jgi:two-component system, OmpR family, phosphate regulon response regulator PhoB
MARIVVIEDEADLASLLDYNLRAEGFTVEVYATGATGLTRIRASRPDLVLVDVMLPDISGTEVVRQLRAGAGPRVPVIMVTARGEESDRIGGLELGADDYVVKPFSVKELVLRVKNVLRRDAEEAATPQQVLTHGDLSIDTERHEVKVGGQALVLTHMEFKLLRTFLERPGRVQTRETLLSDVWGIDADITTRTVDTHIKRLREKLGPAGHAIETIRGVGYKLT